MDLAKTAGSPRPSERRRTYQFGSSRLSLQFGDITSSQAEVIVSSDDYYLSMGGGVSAAIRRAGGDRIVLDAVKKAPAQFTDVVVTSAGALPAQYVFHAITIGPTRHMLPAREALRLIIARCFDLLEALKLHSIAFPAIGAGAAGFSYEDVAIQMAEVVAQRLKSNTEGIDATIFLFDRFGDMEPLDMVRFFEEFRSRQPDIASQAVNDKEPAKSPAASRAVDQPAHLLQARRQQMVYSIAQLDDERGRLEDELAKFQEMENSHHMAEIHSRLNEIQNERIRLKAELLRQTSPAVEVFISYAHEDESFKNELDKHLKILQRQGNIATWHDRKIAAGLEWKGQIDAHLESAQIILLLISPDFMASDYCYDIEMDRALKRHENSEARVIPVILRPVSWSKAPFARLQALPKDGKPVTGWADRDEAMVNVADGIRFAAEEIHQLRSASDSE